MERINNEVIDTRGLKLALDRVIGNEHIKSNIVPNSQQIKKKSHVRLAKLETITKSLKTEAFELPIRNGEADKSKSQICKASRKHEQNQEEIPHKRNQMYNHKSKGELNTMDYLDRNDLELYDHRIGYGKDNRMEQYGKNKQGNKQEGAMTSRKQKYQRMMGSPMTSPRYSGREFISCQRDFQEMRQTCLKERVEARLIEEKAMKLVEKQRRQKKLIKKYKQINNENTEKNNMLESMTRELSTQFSKEQQIIMELRESVSKITADYNKLLEKTKLNEQKTIQLTEVNTQLKYSVQTMNSQIKQLREKAENQRGSSREKQRVLEQKSQKLQELETQITKFEEQTKCLESEIKELKEFKNEIEGYRGRIGRKEETGESMHKQMKQKEESNGHKLILLDVDNRNMQDGGEKISEMEGKLKQYMPKGGELNSNQQTEEITKIFQNSPIKQHNAELFNACKNFAVQLIQKSSLSSSSKTGYIQPLQKFVKEVSECTETKQEKFQQHDFLKFDEKISQIQSSQEESQVGINRRQSEGSYKRSSDGKIEENGLVNSWEIKMEIKEEGEENTGMTYQTISDSKSGKKQKNQLSVNPIIQQPIFHQPDQKTQDEKSQKNSSKKSQKSEQIKTEQPKSFKKVIKRTSILMGECQEVFSYEDDEDPHDLQSVNSYKSYKGSIHSVEDQNIAKEKHLKDMRDMKNKAKRRK